MGMQYKNTRSNQKGVEEFFYSFPSNSGEWQLGPHWLANEIWYDIIPNWRTNQRS